MSFGSDKPGGPVEGIGGREEGIGLGGDTRGQGYQSPTAQAFSEMPVSQQEALFTQEIDRMMSEAYGTLSDLGVKVGGRTLDVALMSAAPALAPAVAAYNKLATISGGKTIGELFTEGVREDVIADKLAEIAGISKGPTQGAFSTEGGEGIQGLMIGAGSMGLWEDITGESAARAATGAAGTAASYLEEAAKYPVAARERLAQVYGLAGTPEEQGAALTGLRETPYYTGVMAGRGAGEEAIMRQAAATGGLRSGNVQQALYDYNVQLEQQALQQSLAGLGGLAGLPTYAGDIASTMAMGQIGAAQAEQAGMGQMLGLAGAAYTGLGGWEGIKDIGGDILSGIGSLF